MSMGQGKPLLYSISILKNYLEFLQVVYPDIDIDIVLQYTGITRFQLEDAGFFYDQETADRFQEIIRKLTNNPNIARDAGRYTVSSKAYRFIRTYIRGFVGPETAYDLLPRIHEKISRGATINIKKVDRGKIEVIVTPTPGIQEKEYQCENRIGQFEAIAAGFTGSYARVDHPECFHAGNDHCRYILSWEEPLFLRINRFRNYSFLALVLIFLSIFHFFTPIQLFHVSLGFILTVIGLTVLGWYFEKMNYQEQIVDQSRAADLLITETNARYNDARLIQDLGQAISRILDADTILETVTKTMEKRLDFDRGIILLANQDKSRLIYKTGYGLTKEQEEFLRNNDLHLDNPESRGPFVIAFKERKPFLIDDVRKLKDELSERSVDILQLSGSQSFICVPIVFEDETLGVLVVDRKFASIPLGQSDLNVLSGIAPQIAISVNNARTIELLHKEEQRYRDLVEGVNSLIVMVDPQGIIKYVNRLPLKYGYQLDEIVGEDIRKFLEPDREKTGGKRYIDRFITYPESISSGKTRFPLKSGEIIWLNWSTKGIRDKDGKLIEILCVGNDITEWMRAEAEKKELEDHLVKSQKMEAIGTLASGVAHDLNNILSGITSYPDLLLMDLPENSPSRKALLTIKKSGERAASIVQDLLTLGRRGVSVSNPININEVVRDYFESPEFHKMKSYHEYVEFNLELSENIWFIVGSGVHLMKTLMNLVSNAAEANPTVIKVNTQNVQLESLKGQGKIIPGNYVLLKVEDNGSGISEVDLKKIFEPFYTKKTMGRSGTGLGMTVVWLTVKDHKGYILVESKLGQGTCFKLYFPASTKEIEQKDTDKPSAA